LAGSGFIARTFVLVTVAAFTEPWEAHLLRGRLSAEGVFAVVNHEHHIGVDWPYALALGGVKVQVHRTDRDKALEIDRLCRTGELQAELAANDADFAAAPCPRCGAHRIGHRRSRPMQALLLVAFLVFDVIFPLRSSVHRCKACGTRWADRTDPACPGP
jgi:hypothetical protein